ncbi:hypothetical protein Poli38472_004856 [Pythium oligandrum]|uniref:Uncharacterized protein n=1 Tax=Pythium oligandrum TaxID=41045 RepID=A0A8K1CCF4_PYTOL|nr:hypothetical protein Poli38472_004856 [Pythium oligandrum]|eukprot:TMW59787.1 hypothetical protein Poli38472_004856 [Pythium oligandrum]
MSGWNDAASLAMEDAGVGSLLDDMEALVPLAELLSTQDAVDEADSTELLWQDIVALETSQANDSETSLTTPLTAPNEVHGNGKSGRSGKKPARTKIPTETRQKQEMAYLRQQVEELESELVRLQGVSSPSEAGSLSEEHSENVSLWADIAKRQRESKRRAEMENMKLRMVVESQLKLIRSLEKVLLKRPHETQTMESQFSDRKRPRFETAEDEREALYRLLRPRMAERIAEIDQVMEECGLQSTWAECYDAQAKLDANNRLYMELCITKLLPFPVDQAADAGWKCLSVPRLELDNGVYGTTDRSDEYCQIQLAVNVRSRNSTSLISVNGVGKRVKQDERVVMVWESHGHTEGQLFDGHNVRLREHGYATIEPAPETKNQAPHSIVKSCVRMWPELQSDSTDDHEPYVGLFIDLVIGSFTENIKVMFQFIENSLLETSLQQ